MRALASLLLLAVSMPGAEKKVVFPPGVKLAGPYSPGILAGDYLYVSGQGAKAADGKFLEGVRNQVRQCLDNVKTIVEAGGLTMDQLVYAQVYVPDAGAYREIEQAWQEYFPKGGPARAMLGVAKLPENTPVEINAVGFRGSIRAIRQAPGYGVPDAIQAGDRFYLSGVGGKDSNAVLNRMSGILKKNGMTLRNLVFLNRYMTGSNDVALDTAGAALASLQVQSLPGSSRVEITGVAVRNATTRHAVWPAGTPRSGVAPPCVSAGDTLFCSLNGGAGDAVEDQVRAAFDKMRTGIEAGALTFANVVAANVYLDNVDDFAKMNAVYKTFFGPAPPTRTTVQPAASGARPKPAFVQISFVLVK